MKSFQVAIVLVVACAVANAEPPRFRSNRFQFQRQEQDPATASEGPYPPAVSAPYPPAMPPQAPYPPSSWKPSGRLFALPARQTADDEQPKDSYGPPPPQNYGPPPPQNYGPPPTEQPTEPESTTTTEATKEESATDEAVTTEPLSETVDVDDKAAEQPKPQSERLTQGGPGFYYVQLPQLQKQQEQQIYLAPQQVQSAPLRALPTVAAAAVQPVVYASQPLGYTSGYYVSYQSW